MTTPSRANTGGSTADRIVRHALADRLLHWVSAACVLTLLGTAFLPIVGVEFAWVTVHWVAGARAGRRRGAPRRARARARHVALDVARRADLADALDVAGATLRRTLPTRRPGKYSVAQKLIHHAFAAAVLTTLVTGGLMLLRIDTPWWQRNPYLLADATWGIVFVLHGLAALVLVTMVMMHVYFALRPEKLEVHARHDSRLDHAPRVRRAP